MSFLSKTYSLSLSLYWTVLRSNLFTLFTPLSRFRWSLLYYFQSLSNTLWFKTSIIPTSYLATWNYASHFFGKLLPTFSLGLALAILAYLKHLNIGEGDFLYLASASLIFPFSQILLAIEIACLLGLIYFLISKDLKQKSRSFLLVILFG